MPRTIRITIRMTSSRPTSEISMRPFYPMRRILRTGDGSAS